MAKWHNTPDGPKRCMAFIRSCKYASLEGSNHFSSLEEAQARFEWEMQKEHKHLESKRRQDDIALESKLANQSIKERTDELKKRLGDVWEQKSETLSHEPGGFPVYSDEVAYRAAYTNYTKDYDDTVIVSGKNGDRYGNAEIVRGLAELDEEYIEKAVQYVTPTAKRVLLRDVVSRKVVSVNDVDSIEEPFVSNTKSGDERHRVTEVGETERRVMYSLVGYEWKNGEKVQDRESRIAFEPHNNSKVARMTTLNEMKATYHKSVLNEAARSKIDYYMTSKLYDPETKTGKVWGVEITTIESEAIEDLRKGRKYG